MAGARMSREKRLAWMAGVRISRKKKGLVLRPGPLLENPENQPRIFIHGFRLQLFLCKSHHFGQLVWGGLSGSPKARLQRNLVKM